MAADRKRGPVALDDVARRIAPRLGVVSVSQPTPTLRRHNLLVLAGSLDASRDAVLALESMEYDGDKLGTVVMGRQDDPSAADAGVDPEGVAGRVVPRVLVGALLGAAAGAAIGAAAGALMSAQGWGIVGWAVLGAILVSAFGALWVAFAGLGGSDAFRQTFVDDEVSELAIVSLHSDDAGDVAKAKEQLTGRDGLELVEVDAEGHRVGATRST